MFCLIISELNEEKPLNGISVSQLAPVVPPVRPSMAGAPPTAHALPLTTVMPPVTAQNVATVLQRERAAREEEAERAKGGIVHAGAMPIHQTAKPIAPAGIGEAPIVVIFKDQWF